MSLEYIDKADIEARKRALKLFRERFMEILRQLERGENPTLVLPKRTLQNTIYDEKRKLLLLGPEKLRRSFFDLHEARKFMQTLLMARIIYEALERNEYPTIRDLYYRGKHTIVVKGFDRRPIEENTWDEQRESDAVIRDIEVFTGMLREEMLILSKEKGKVVGYMKIRSGNDVIDLSKMGHGAYAIEPTPDLIEFIDVDAEYVLVVEKDAVFQQLHRIGFWRKHKVILITSAGQPDRATRRFVRRLNEELKLPVYILTDADPYGWYIYSVFKIGSITLSYESERLATPSARFLGVSMTDIFGYGSKKPYLSEAERRLRTPKWKVERDIFLKKKAKLEIEALTSKGLRFLADKYIPEKIQTGDWID